MKISCREFGDPFLNLEPGLSLWIDGDSSLILPSPSMFQLAMDIEMNIKQASS